LSRAKALSGSGVGNQRAGG